MFYNYTATGLPSGRSMFTWRVLSIFMNVMIHWLVARSFFSSWIVKMVFSLAIFVSNMYLYLLLTMKFMEVTVSLSLISIRCSSSSRSMYCRLTGYLASFPDLMSSSLMKFTFIPDRRISSIFSSLMISGAPYFVDFFFFWNYPSLHHFRNVCFVFQFTDVCRDRLISNTEMNWRVLPRVIIIALPCGVEHLLRDIVELLLSLLALLDILCHRFFWHCLVHPKSLLAFQVWPFLRLWFSPGCLKRWDWKNIQYKGSKLI